MSPQLAAANRTLNLSRNPVARRYGFAWLAWLENGAAGNEPERGRLSRHGAEAVRRELMAILGPEPLAAVRGAV